MSNMNWVRTRALLLAAGALLGLITQLNWLSGHGWGEAWVRIPLGLVAGGVVFWGPAEIIGLIFRAKGGDFWGRVQRAYAFMQKGPVVSALVGTFLVFFLGFMSGWIVYSGKHGPYQIMRDLEKFLFTQESLTLVQKLKNDFGIYPYRHLAQYQVPANQLRSYKKLQGVEFSPERKRPLLFLAPNAPKGFRLIFGYLYFPVAKFGALLLDPRGKPVHEWRLGLEEVPWEHEAKTNLFPHGLAVGKDGSIYVCYDNGNSLAKYDWCGRLVWRVKGAYHHSIAFESDSYIWVWGDPQNKSNDIEQMVKVDTKTGQVVKQISLFEVMRANPDIDILAIRQIDQETRSLWAEEGEAAGTPTTSNRCPPSWPIYTRSSVPETCWSTSDRPI